MGGTFSFMEDHAVIQDALAQCIGGLRSVTAQDVFLEISCAQDDDDLNVTAVKAGRSVTNKFPDDEGSVDVSELYVSAEEFSPPIAVIYFVERREC